jgi:hypothetical protein
VVRGAVDCGRRCAIGLGGWSVRFVVRVGIESVSATRCGCTGTARGHPLAWRSSPVRRGIYMSPIILLACFLPRVLARLNPPPRSPPVLNDRCYYHNYYGKLLPVGELGSGGELCGRRGADPQPGRPRPQAPVGIAHLL